MPIKNNGFEILPHTADVRLKIIGKTKADLFSNAIKGMASILKPSVFDKAFKHQRITQMVKVKSLDIDTLLIDFLSEVLALSDINSSVFYEIDFKSFSDEELEAEIMGSKIGEFDEDIKAVTYHESKIDKNDKNLWETTVVFDI